MKIQFDSQQQYQIDAVNAVLDVFDGQPLAQGQFEIGPTAGTGELLSELGFGNRLALQEEVILENLLQVQAWNGIERSVELDGMNFTTEMETGTGKTYVYLRTIHEMHARYGFNKFVIAVPSVAIREGVKTSIEITREHFRALFDEQPFDYWVYDSRRVSFLRQFATSNQLQVLIINIDAFNKPTNNVIHQENDRLSGRKPIEFIQATSPIVILDEPQNMESEPAKAAIESLKPMCILRYSATHRNLYNLIYRLSPVDAYDMKLVKRIEVDSVLDDPDFNQPFISVNSISATRTRITAKLTIDMRDKSGPKRKNVTVSRNGVDLFDLSGEREMYQGYIVDHIDAGNKYVAFTNGERLYEGQTVGENRDERMRVQVRETVREHLEKELRIYNMLPKERRLKVLSLFFIDRVANYADEDGKIRCWFVEAYEELSKQPYYEPLSLLPVDEVHNGYFAKDRSGPKDTTGKTKADDEAYEIIMKDKERLLSPEEPLRFIFSHSALREGWDNPNVFQICTLNESRTELRKRQEIGRGLRLPVDASGERSFDPNVNKLTVIANESYAEFASALQTEIEEETGVEFKDRIANKRERRKANLKKNWRLDENFKELWTRIKHKTRYSVGYDTQELVSRASKAVWEMPEIHPPKIRIEKGDLRLGEGGVDTGLLSSREANVAYGVVRIPDLLGHIQRETELTRGTIVDILVKSDRLGDMKINPQQFMDGATRAIRRALDELMVDGIKYERIAGAEYKMLLFEDKEIDGYVSRMLEVKKSIYDAIEYDSGTEKQFARDLDSREDIKLFIKLPSWFTVETPIGTYNPDWAIVKQPNGKQEKLYLVKETKSDLDPAKRRPDENAKIKCGAAHFDSLPDVEFQVVNDAKQV